jgi:TRAP transporter TAXI family solute receptor
MKKVLIIALVAISLFSLVFVAACSKTTTTTAVATGLPKNIIFTTGPTTGSAYALNTIFADIVNKYTTMKAFLLPTAGMEAGQIIGVEEGIGQLGQPTSFGTWLAFNGQGDYVEGGPRTWIRIIQAGRITPFGFVVRGDSGIKTMADLKGKRVAVKYNDVTTPIQAAGFLKAAGLDPEKDVQVFAADDAVMGNKLMLEGRLDAYCTGATAPFVTEAAKSVGAFVVPFTEEQLQRIGEVLPGYIPYFVKGGIFASIPNDSWVPGVVSVLICKDDLNDETAYTLVKVITEHVEEYSSSNAEIGKFNINGAVMAEPPVPYHPGSIKYLKEKGVWSANMDTVQAKLLKEAQDLAKSAK